MKAAQGKGMNRPFPSPVYDCQVDNSASYSPITKASLPKRETTLVLKEDKK
jgi:hypothetical protein